MCLPRTVSPLRTAHERLKSLPMTTDPKSENITWNKGHVTPADREAQNGHQSAILWFTGLSGSGKSTLANAVERALFDLGCRTYVLDGDNVRHGLNNNLGFSPEDRVENIRRIGEVAKLFTDAGLITLTAFISPYRADRAKVREIAAGKFIEVYVKADVATCEARDPKGLYKMARAGAIPEFTGISAPYEEPEHPEITVDTAALSVEEGVGEVLAALRARGVVKSA